MNTLEYKDFIATIQFSDEDNLLYGKLEGVNDLITFQGDNVKDLREAFIEAVEDYLYLCKLKKKDPFKSFKGSFNIRINPDMHRKAYFLAKKKSLSLNQFVAKAIENELETSDS